MTNEFKKDYEKEQEIKALYERDKDAAIEQMKVFRESLSAKGEEYGFVYRLYSEACERGNEYIDISEPSEYHDEQALLDKLRKFGIERITFSSGWSSAIKSAWEFQRRGCRLEGLVEINSQYKAWDAEGYEKAYGYLFTIS